MYNRGNNDVGQVKTKPGIFRSTDGGKWTHTFYFGSPDDRQPFGRIELAAGRNNRVYAGLDAFNSQNQKFGIIYIHNEYEDALLLQQPVYE